MLNNLSQQIWTQPIAGLRTVRVDTRQWTAGVYYIRVSANGRIETRKIVVER